MSVLVTHPLPVSPGKSVVPCMYTGSYASVCTLQEPLASLGNQPRAVSAASIPSDLRYVCSPSLGPSEMSSMLQGKPSREGGIFHWVLRDQEDFTAGLHETFREPTERNCCAQKLGLVKTLEPIKKSSSVHEKNLGFHCFAN